LGSGFLSLTGRRKRPPRDADRQAQLIVEARAGSMKAVNTACGPRQRAHSRGVGPIFRILLSSVVALAIIVLALYVRYLP
jgi:hypothetical protein